MPTTEPLPDYLRDEQLEARLVEMGKVTPQQEWADKWLNSLTQDQLLVLHLRVKKMTPEQKEMRDQLLEDCTELHSAWMNETPKKSRFNSPGKGMLGARSRELYELRIKENRTDQLIPFGAPEKPKSVLDQ